MIKSDIYSKTQACLDCGKEYPASHVVKGDHDVDVSQGYCTECMHARIYKPIKVQCLSCAKTFETHYLGFSTMKLFIPHLCPDCQKKKDSNKEAVRLSEIAKIRLKWRQTSGIPQKFMPEDFSTFVLDKKNGNTVKIFNICKDYADHFPPVPYFEYIRKEGKAYPSLVLFSTLDMCGVGKTHLTAGINHRILDSWQGQGVALDESSVRWVCSYSNPVLFVSEPKLYSRIQTTYSYSDEERKREESEQDIVRQMIYTPVLTLDDVGKEPRRDMDFVRRTLFNIIDGRYTAMRPIVMTTNKTPDELCEYLGQASFDRIYEMCEGTLWQMEGRSYRQKEV